MEIIKEPTKNKWRGSCDVCECEIIVDVEEVETVVASSTYKGVSNYSVFVECPYCGTKIYLKHFQEK